jgi:type III secretion protein F
MTASISSAFTGLIQSVQTSNADLGTRMSEVMSNGKDLDQTELLNLQFEMGQYNARMELTSSLSKGITDMLKTLAQRTS